MNQSKTTALVIVAAIILLAIGIAFTRYQSAHSPTLVAAATPQPAAQVTTVATSQPVTTTMPKFDVNGFKDRLVSFGMPIKDVSIFTDSPLALSINFTSASTLDVEIASYVVDYAARSEAVNGVFIHELGGLGKIIQDNEYIKSVSKKNLSDKSAESAVRRVLGIDSAEGLRLVNVQVRTLNFPSGQKQYVVVKMTNTLETIKFLKSIGESSGDSDYFPIIARINPLANLSDAPDIDLLFVAVTYDTLKGSDPIIYMRNLYGPTGDITTNDTRLYTQPAGEQRPPLLQSPLWTPTPKPAP